MKTKHYLITAVAAYLVFLIHSLPAAPVLGYLTSGVERVKVSGISGSLWHGRATSVSIDDYRLDDLSWSFSAMQLLGTRFGFDIEAKFYNRPLSASVATSLWSRLHIADLSMQLDANRLGKIIDLPMGELTGMVELDLDEARWSPGQIPELHGHLSWHNAAILIAGATRLGDIDIDLQATDDSPLLATISNQGGQLDIDGQARVNPEAAYELNISLTPTKSANANLRNSLKFVAKPGAGGKYEIKRSGSLSQLGLI